MLNGFCSPCGSDFQSVSVCIAMNKPCVPKTSDYLIFGLCAQLLLVWTEKDWKFSLECRLSCHCQQLCCKYEEGVQQHSSMGLACFGRHLIHNVVTAGFAALKNNVHNSIQTEARQRKQVLER